MKRDTPTAFTKAAASSPDDAPKKVCFFLLFDNKFWFVLRENKDLVCLEPAGGAIEYDKGETVEDAIRREAGEEFGVEVEPLRHLGTEPHPFSGKPVAYYAVKHISGTPFNAADTEHLDVIDICPSKIDQLPSACAELTHNGKSVECRVPLHLARNFLQQVGYEESGAAFTAREPASP